MPVEEDLPQAGAVQRRRVLEPRHAVARVKLHAQRVRMRHGHVERVHALLLKVPPALGVHAVAAPPEVLLPLHDLGTGDPAEEARAVAPARLPVDAGDVGVAVGLDLAPHFFFRGEPEQVVRPVRVVVREEAARVPALLVRLPDLKLVVGQWHQLDVSHACRRAAERPGRVARRHPPDQLADIEAHVREVRNLPEHLRHDRPVPVGQQPGLQRRKVQRE